MDTIQADVVDVRADGRARSRKVYSEANKRRVVALTFERGVSVSQVAQRHGLNTNLLLTWRRRLGYARARWRRRRRPRLPVTVSAPSADAKADVAQPDADRAYIELEIKVARMILETADETSLMDVSY